MLIDWFTVAAQITNFLVLVWLLKRFLYGPILHAMAEREKRIQNTIESANAQKTEAERERAEFQQKNAAFDRKNRAWRPRPGRLQMRKSSVWSRQPAPRPRRFVRNGTKVSPESRRLFAKSLRAGRRRKLSGSLGRRSRTSLARNSTTALPRSLSSGSKTWTATSANALQRSQGRRRRLSSCAARRRSRHTPASGSKPY